MVFHTIELLMFWLFWFQVCIHTTTWSSGSWARVCQAPRKIQNRPVIGNEKECIKLIRDVFYFVFLRITSLQGREILQVRLRQGSLYEIDGNPPALSPPLSPCCLLQPVCQVMFPYPNRGCAEKEFDTPDSGFQRV